MPLIAAPHGNNSAILILYIIKKFDSENQANFGTQWHSLVKAQTLTHILFPLFHTQAAQKQSSINLQTGTSLSCSIVWATFLFNQTKYTPTCTKNYFEQEKNAIWFSRIPFTERKTETSQGQEKKGF